MSIYGSEVERYIVKEEINVTSNWYPNVHKTRLYICSAMSVFRSKYYYAHPHPWVSLQTRSMIAYPCMREGETI